MSNQQSLGIKLAQLSRDASAAVSPLINNRINAQVSQTNTTVSHFVNFSINLSLVAYLGCGTSLELTSPECGDRICRDCREDK